MYVLSVCAKTFDFSFCSQTGFGTFPAAVKLIPTGDGIFFQWVMCCAILVVGYCDQFIAHAADKVYYFEPLAMIGGAVWCIGNATVVLVVKSVGMSMGILLYGIVNMLTGWLAGTIGIWVDKDTVPSPALNYTGVVIAAGSFFLYFLVNPVVKNKDEEEEKKETEEEDVQLIQVQSRPGTGELPFYRTKVFGIFLSVFSGLCYGFNMLPVSKLASENKSANSLAFALSHFSGIFIMSTLIMLVYSIGMKNKPFVHQKTIIGGLIAGTLWALGQSAWFVANRNLGFGDCLSHNHHRTWNCRKHLGSIRVSRDPGEERDFEVVPGIWRYNLGHYFHCIVKVCAHLSLMNFLVEFLY